MVYPADTSVVPTTIICKRRISRKALQRSPNRHFNRVERNTRRPPNGCLHDKHVIPGLTICHDRPIKMVEPVQFSVSVKSGVDDCRFYFTLAVYLHQRAFRLSRQGKENKSFLRGDKK